MMYLKKHLLHARIVEGIIFSLFFLNACNDSSKPDEYVARVNQSYLTQEELSYLVDTSSSSKANVNETIRNWVQAELLYQRAESEGIINEPAFEQTIENSKKQLAGSLLIKKILQESTTNVTKDALEKYYNQNRSSFTLSSNHYLLNRARFNDYFKAVQFRSELIASGWDSALDEFENDSSLISISSSTLLNEYDIYPSHILRVIQGLYPLEISIVISDEPGYYTVLEVLDRFEIGSIPSFNVIEQLVEKRFMAEKQKVSIHNYIKELYKENEVELNY